MNKLVKRLNRIRREEAEKVVVPEPVVVVAPAEPPVLPGETVKNPTTFKGLFSTVSRIADNIGRVAQALENRNRKMEEKNGVREIDKV